MTLTRYLFAIILVIVYLCFKCVHLSTITNYPSNDTIVQLPKGKIQGHILKSDKGNNYYAFQEIPYASPPIGENRFQLAKEPESWSGILDTTKNTKICYQKVELPIDVQPSEDCLYLNVYTPVKPGSKNLLPVLVWIHGGALQNGSGIFQNHGPKFLIDSDIVIVTFNYRLGPFGFVGTKDGVIPLNIGFKDQQVVIQWVNENIHLFGGDPNHIILDGESAGSRSVGFHLIGPWLDNKQLFHGVIMQSATPVSETLLQTDETQTAFNLGRAVDPSFSSNDTKDLLKVLQKAKAADILQTSIAGGVSIENDGPFSYPGYEAFLNGNYKNIPVLIGFNSEEYVSTVLYKDEAVLESYDADPSQLISRFVNMSPENKTIAGNLLKQIYTGNTSFVENFAGFVRSVSDQGFTTSTCKQVELASPHNPYYLYQFAYKGELGGRMDILPFLPPGLESVGHAEDVFYLWDAQFNDDLSSYPEKDQLTSHRMIKMWTNFVKYFNPTPEKDPLLGNITWLTSEPNTLRYLNINGTLEMRQHPRQYQQVKVVLETYMEPPYIAFT